MAEANGGVICDSNVGRMPLIFNRVDRGRYVIILRQLPHFNLKQDANFQRN
jgi:hypothetical protein